MRSDLGDIACRVRRETDDAIAIADGSTLPDGRERWTWLPKSQVEIERSEKIDTVTMPEWLAKKKGLI